MQQSYFRDFSTMDEELLYLLQKGAVKIQIHLGDDREKIAHYDGAHTLKLYATNPINSYRTDDLIYSMVRVYPGKIDNVKVISLSEVKDLLAYGVQPSKELTNKIFIDWNTSSKEYDSYYLEKLSQLVSEHALGSSSSYFMVSLYRYDFPDIQVEPDLLLGFDKEGQYLFSFNTCTGKCVLNHEGYQPNNLLSACLSIPYNKYNRFNHKFPTESHVITDVNFDLKSYAYQLEQVSESYVKLKDTIRHGVGIIQNLGSCNESLCEIDAPAPYEGTLYGSTLDKQIELQRDIEAGLYNVSKPKSYQPLITKLEKVGVEMRRYIIEDLVNQGLLREDQLRDNTQHFSSTDLKQFDSVFYPEVEQKTKEVVLAVVAPKCDSLCSNILENDNDLSLEEVEQLNANDISYVSYGELSEDEKIQTF